MSARIAVFSASVFASLFVLLAALPAAAQGTTRVTIKNPDPAKWAGRNNFFSKSTGEYTCRPLACSDAAKVTASISNSPTRSPDPQALAKLAARIPESVALANANIASSMTPGRKIEKMSSGVTTLRGYPAIVQEVRMVGGEKGTIYSVKASIFAKSALVNIASVSPSLELARRNRELFIKAMEVEDTPVPR
jgi:hypothetical protein